MKRFIYILLAALCFTTASAQNDSTGVKVVAGLVPNSPSDLYPTNFERWMQGGYKSVNTIQELFGISDLRRKIGMVVRVMYNDTIPGNDSLFCLQGSLNNYSWKNVTGTGSNIPTLSQVTGAGKQTNYGIDILDSATTIAPTPTVFFFGDSWTFGVAATSTDRNYVSLLCAQHGWSISNRGTTGATAQINGGDSSFAGKANLLPYFVSPSATPAIFFMYGVNDIRLSSINYTAAGYSQTINACIDTLIRRGWPPNRIYGLSPGYFKDPQQAYVDGRSATYIDTLSNLARYRGINFFNVRAVMQPYGDTFLNTASGDSLHPNNAGHFAIDTSVYRWLRTLTAPLVYSASESYFNEWGLSKFGAVGFPKLGAQPNINRTYMPYMTGDSISNGITFVYPGRESITISDTTNFVVGRRIRLGWPKPTVYAYIMATTTAPVSGQISRGTGAGAWTNDVQLTYVNGVFNVASANDQTMISNTSVNITGANSAAATVVGRNLDPTITYAFDTSGQMHYFGTAYNDPVSNLFHKPGSVSFSTCAGVVNGTQLESWSGKFRIWNGPGSAYNEVLRIDPLQRWTFGDTVPRAAMTFRPKAAGALVAGKAFMFLNAAGDSAAWIDDATKTFTVNGNLVANTKVDTVFNNATNDSLVYLINGRRHALPLTAGGGGFWSRSGTTLKPTTATDSVHAKSFAADSIVSAGSDLEVTNHLRAPAIAPPTATLGVAAGSGSPVPGALVLGSDVAHQVTVNTGGTLGLAGDIVTIHFNRPYKCTPIIVFSAISDFAVTLMTTVTLTSASATGYTFTTSAVPGTNEQLIWNVHVIDACGVLP